MAVEKDLPENPKPSVGFFRQVIAKIYEIIDYLADEITTSSLKVDTISEKTEGNGVTIAGVDISEGTIDADFIIGTMNETVIGNDGNVGKLICKRVEIGASGIVGTSANTIGHALGAQVVADADVDANHVVEFVSAIIINDFDTAAYTGGGDDMVMCDGAGTAVSTTVAKAGMLGAAGNKLRKLMAVDANMTPGKGLRIKGTAFTQPGTAAGILRVQVSYRIHKTGL